MTIPSRRTAVAVRGAGPEAAATAHHPAHHLAGIPPEQRAHPCPGRPVPSAVRPRPDPVLLLHGTADDRAVLTPLRRTLHRHGWTHLHVLNHAPLGRDVRAAAVLLARHVEWAVQAHDGRPVALVGHGLGGLIVRYYVQRLGGHALVTAVVTPATPHGGTTATPLPGPLPVAGRLRPGGGLPAELALPAPECGTRFTAVHAEPDGTVPPRANARLDHPGLPAVRVAAPEAGPLGLPARPPTVTAVHEALERWAAGPLTERHAC
ncbi:esterase/lipase family protein [Kitasatospora sp. NBC_01539]|uniref:esterase/lipase family protein n=1 Tax=Kitasatospora sp. NBC_01539 TaxID=2903577 RepID=UPI00386026E3